MRYAARRIRPPCRAVTAASSFRRRISTTTSSASIARRSRGGSRWASSQSRMSPTKARSSSRTRAYCTSSISSGACTKKAATSSRSRWTPPWDFDGRRGAHGRCDARGRRRHRAGDVRRRSMAGPRRLPAQDAEAVETRVVGLRGARREARARREADLRAAALLLQRRHRGRSGNAARAHARVSRRRRAARASLRRFRRVLPSRAGALRSGGGIACARPSPIRSSTARCASFTAPARIGGAPKTAWCWSRATRRAQVARLRDAGLPTLMALAQARPGTAVPADRAAHVRDAARSGGAAARAAEFRPPRLASHRRRSWNAASSCCRARRPAT